MIRPILVTASDGRGTSQSGTLRALKQERELKQMPMGKVRK